MPGVVRTRVGYAGGKQRNPTYHSLGDHTETVEIDYDPARISYEKLLSVFWMSHDPAAGSWSRQYMAAVFFHNEEQQTLALKSRDRESSRLKTSIKTEILPYTGFTPAEDYHQKFHLRNEYGLLEEFRQIYPETKDFVASTAVARVNGYLGGYGTLVELRKELESYGLSERGKNRLMEIVAGSGIRRAPCPLPQIKDT
jgi:methionine-S-sulfoxide reductase